MIFINLLVILLYIMLALLSRKHFSKYKGRKPGYIKGLWLAMSEFVYTKIEDRINWNGIKSSIRRIQVVSPKGVDNLTKRYAVGIITVCLVVVFVFNLISGFMCIREGNTESTNIIEREDYQGNTKKQDIYLDVDGNTFVYSMGVAPVEYTEEEFYQRAEKMLAEMEDTMLGSNDSPEHISSDLVLPMEGEAGIFKIIWSSDHPEYITATGKVHTEEIDECVPVVLTAAVEYLDYSVIHDYVLVVERPMENAGNPRADIVGHTLDRIESANRNRKTIKLPSEISGVGISLVQRKENTSARILLLGIMVSAILTGVSISRLKEAGKNRDNILMKQYPAFVNKLWLLLGTGMTIKAGIKQIITESKSKDILIRELEYAVNQIDSGFDEAAAYEQLGSRLGLTVYCRLMGHISQNLKMGNRDLLELMEEEVSTSLGERKEFARKKGEEASTKLLIPMIMLMITVMVIIIFPAVISF